MQRQKSKYPLYSIIAFVITLFINYATMTGFLGTYDQKSISDKYRNLITPASFAFSIWSVIYGLILIFLIYQFYLLYKTKYVNRVYDKLNIFFIITCIFNSLWNILRVNDQILLSTVAILALTITLIMINIYIKNKENPRFASIIPITFGIYCGRLTVATVTNVAALLVKIRRDRFLLSEDLMAVITYLIVVLLAGLIIYIIKNPLYNFPIIRAFAAIYVMLTNDPPKANVARYLPAMSIIVMILLLLESIYIFRKNGNSLLPVREERNRTGVYNS